MRIPAYSAVLLPALALAGCVDIHFGPRLPVEFVSNDDALLGIWLVTGSGHTAGHCTIEEIAIPVEDGLINPASPETYLVGSENAPSEDDPTDLFYETAYRITIRAYEPVENGKVLYGYVVPIGEEKYLGVHVGLGELAKSLGPILTVPTFMLMKYELDDERLRVWLPRTVAFLVPTADWAEAGDGAPALWVTETNVTEAADSIKAMGGLMLSPTIQELIAYYEQHATEDGFFVDHVYEFTRDPPKRDAG